VLTGGAGLRAMTAAFTQLFGVRDAFAQIEMPGRTDAWLLRQALLTHDIPLGDPRVREYRSSYIRHLPQELRHPPPPGARKGVLPGVRNLLDALAGRECVYLALLTGNYEPAAKLKLEYFDLWKYFRWGAFGDDATDRNGLLPAALARVPESGGPAVTARDTVVIGDTPLDVAVAKAGGARSIGVATGSHPVDRLRDAGADVVFTDLHDTAAVLEALGV